MTITPQGVGMSFPCASSNHGGCQEPGCRCTCHYRKPLHAEKRNLVSTPVERMMDPPNDATEIRTAAPVTTAGLVCVKCGKPPKKEGDKFCRYCGTPIEVPAFCGNCGTKGEPGDIHCSECGAPLTAEIQTKAPPRKRVRKSTSPAVQ